MRRLVAAALAAAVVAIAGCGGSSGGGGDSFSYLPADTPFAVAISTDVNGEQYQNVNAILDRFPFSGRIKDSLKQQLEAQGLSYDKDLKPLLGNDFVVGAVDAKSLLSDSSNRFVGAIDTKDGDKLKQLIQKDSKKVGESHGATLYESSGSTVAVDGSTLVVADTREDLDQALTTHEADSHLTADDFGKATENLPGDTLVRGFFDVQELLASDPSSADARKVKWVASLRHVGFSASAEKDAIDIDFDAQTDPDGLTAADLPLATGEAAPPVAGRSGDIAVGIRDPAQIVKFAERAVQAVNPEDYGDYATAKAQIGKQLGVDIDRDVIAQLGGNSSLSVDTAGHWGFRAELADPDKFRATLAKLAKALPRLAREFGLEHAALARPRGKDGFYALAGSKGESIVFGVVNDVFVASNDPKRAADLAAGKPQQVPGTKGSLVTGSNAEAIVNAILSQEGGLGSFGGLGARLFTAPLGRLTGWVTSSTSGLRGHLELGFDSSSGGGSNGDSS